MPSWLFLMPECICFGGWLWVESNWLIDSYSKYIPWALNIKMYTWWSKIWFDSLLFRSLYSPFDELLMFLILLFLFFHINDRVSFHDSFAQQEVIPQQLLLPGGHCNSFNGFGAMMVRRILLIVIFMLVYLHFIVRWLLIMA